eukprot:TRINITY_DN8512_c0_g1_i1.p1 TRINITY_DN8512_c0_g1~~TRINITY_DN8512_c0_g1_i1.p1  ORF type:complete len:566 (+),score=96.96 TRINITY_DN8512_c0_g1_i1:77-1774(+)
MFRSTSRALCRKLSHAKGSTTDPLIELTIDRQLRKMVDRQGDETFITCSEQGIRKTWGGFSEDVDKVAAGLISLGYEPGQRIGIWLPNYYEWILFQFSCHRIGAVLVNINPGYRTHELRHALNCVGCRGILMTDNFKTSNYTNLITELFPELKGKPTGSCYELNSEQVPSLRHIFSINSAKLPGAAPVEAIMVQHPDSSKIADLESTVSVHDPANIQYTSGTTGLPKPATLTHHNIVNNGLFVGKRLQYTNIDKVCIPVPMYHCFGTVLGVMAALTSGASVVFPSPGFCPSSSLNSVLSEECTALYGVPTMFIQMLLKFDELEAKDQAKISSHLRTGIMAGSNCPPMVMSEVVEKLGMEDVSICYGMTETSPVSWQTPIGAPRHLKCETVGTIHEHVECKVVDESGNTVPTGTPGELLTKGYNVMKGYYNMEQETKESITEDGFMMTGDLATISDDGYCRIVGRKKDMIIRGGENIYPAEVEAFLHTCPSVQDVAVKGLPHDTLGEQVAAWIIPTDSSNPPSHADIKEFCANQIAHYKIPSKVFIVDAFPLTATGKIQKFLLEEQ